MQFIRNKGYNNNAYAPPTYVQHTKRQITAVTQSPSLNKPPSKMNWGEPTWFLFHTMAEKIKDDKFDIFRVEILNLITSICNTLPCPSCATHATEYIRNININTIKTKSDLQIMLFTFHNEVNVRKGYALFNYSELSVKYSKANFINIIYNFMKFFQEKNRNVRMLANDMYKERIIRSIKLWFNANISIFNE